IRTGGSVARYATAEALERALQIPYRVALSPRGAGKFYFLCRLEVTTLNDTDLEELTRWLKGDVSPAVSGRGSVGSALTRGAQRRRLPRPRECAAPRRVAARARQSHRVAARDASPRGRSEPRPASPPGPPRRRPRRATRS